MGMRGEIRDFVGAFSAFRKQAMDENNSATRNKYYQALIDNQGANQKIQQARLGLEQQQVGNTRDYQQGQLGIQRDRLNWQKQNGVGGGGNSVDSLTSDGGVAIPPSSRPAVGDGAFNGGSSMPVPYMAGPGSPSDPGMQYDYAAGADAGSYAQGGAVGDDQPAPQDAGEAIGQTLASPAPPQQPTQPAAQAAPAAVGDDDSSQDSAPSQPSQSDTENPSGGNANTYGFNMQKVLQRWGVQGNTTGANPVKLGMDAFVKSLQGKGAVPTGNPQDAQDALKSIHTNEGASTQEEVDALNKTIDPENELGPSAKVVARLDGAVNYWMNKGDVVKAQKTAKMLLAYGKMSSQKYGEAAVDAMQRGNWAPGVKYLQQAYDQVPDGQSLNASVAPDGSIHASVAGPDGKPQDLGVFGPQQVFKLALGVKNGTEYMNRIATIANGGNAPAQAQATPMKYKDFQGVESGVNDAFTNMQNAKQPIEADTANAVKSVATGILADPANRQAGLGTSDAVMGAAQIAMPQSAQPNFTARPANGGVAVKFNDGRQMFVPQAQFERLMMVRTARLKAMQQQSQQSQPPDYGYRGPAPQGSYIPEAPPV